MDDLQALYKRYNDLKLREAQKKDEDPFEKMEFSRKTSDYTDDRENLLKKFRQWLLESAFQIRVNFVNSVYDQKRLRRVVDVIKKIKVCLKATTPLGIKTEDSEEDKLFLGSMMTNEELINLRWKMQTERRISTSTRLCSKTEEAGWEESRNIGNTYTHQENAPSRDLDTEPTEKEK